MHYRQQTAGFAQLVVLSGLALLSAMVLALYDRSSNDLQLQAGLKQLYENRIATASAARRVFAAIEDDSDPLEMPLIGSSMTPLTFASGNQEFEISLEHEAGKISVWTSEQLVLDRYLALAAPFSALPQSAASDTQNRSTELQNAVSIKFLAARLSPTFNRDFSPFHLASTVDFRWASERVLAATGGGRDSQNTGEAAQGVLALVVGNSLKQARRYVFSVTSGGKVMLLGTSD